MQFSIQPFLTHLERYQKSEKYFFYITIKASGCKDKTLYSLMEIMKIVRNFINKWEIV